MPTTPTELRLPWGGHFEKEKLPDARSFYERELGKLGRTNSKGWSAANCPFHNSESRRSFSFHFSGAFGCFGCGVKGGDLVDFVRLRDKCDFKTACRRLGAWLDVTLTREGRLQLAEVFAETERRRAAKQQQSDQEEEAARRERLGLRDEFHASYRLYEELTGRLGELGRGAAPAYEGEKDHIWSLLPNALEDIRLSDRMYCEAAELEATE